MRQIPEGHMLQGSQWGKKAKRQKGVRSLIPRKEGKKCREEGQPRGLTHGRLPGVCARHSLIEETCGGSLHKNDSGWSARHLPQWCSVEESMG